MIAFLVEAMGHKKFIQTRSALNYIYTHTRFTACALHVVSTYGVCHSHVFVSPQSVKRSGGLVCVWEYFEDVLFCFFLDFRLRFVPGLLLVRCLLLLSSCSQTEECCLHFVL